MHPYSILSPVGPQNGILFNSPHSGTYLPDDFLKQISIAPEQLHYSGDMFVDRLITDTPKFGATGFINHYARTYVDTNRTAREIDPDMFINPPQRDKFTKSDKVMRGFGIFSRRSYNGQGIYSHPLPASEINYRLDRVYHPVHAALSELLKKIHQDHGYYLLLDCHSMPSYNFIGQELSRATQPDLIIGDCFSQSCIGKISQHVAGYFTNHGLKVAFNTPYSGGFNTQEYGKPAGGRNALQLEFNRALYMDEKTLKVHDGFMPLQDLLTGLSDNLDRNLSGFFPAEQGL
ncbi:N-formylglutamate deformylase [hydrothermal vent metagenome]|uniref:N-formylglutamate deformylase n=1 Tax=hydrothermal vent metagenome TaxID=652676 RepID=A0A3B0SCI9_9ZZZZ